MEKGTRIDVLDKGYVQLVDWIGSDESIVEAARISTGRGFVSWDPYKRCKKCDWLVLDEKVNVMPRTIVSGCVHEWEPYPRGDLGILEYLYKMEHTSPFEMVDLIVDIKCPMDIWRQIIRNRTASVNEYSTRYSEAIDDMMVTAPDAWRTQGKTNRQGSGEYLTEWPVGSSAPSKGMTPGEYLSMREKQLHTFAREVYKERLDFGVAKEQARKDLPLSTYTFARRKMNLHNLLKFYLKKRLHPHAQIENQRYAQAIAEFVKAIWPKTWLLFEKYDLKTEA